MLGHGYLLSPDQVAPSDWRWPYVVTENTQNRGSDNQLSKPLFGSAQDYYEPEEDYGYQEVLPIVMRTLQCTCFM